MPGSFHDRLASDPPLRSDHPVWRWLKKRAGVHLAIVFLFVVSMVGLLTIKPNNDHPYAGKVKLWFDSLEYSSIDTRINFGRKAKADPRIVLLSSMLLPYRWMPSTIRPSRRRGPFP